MIFLIVILVNNHHTEHWCRILIYPEPNALNQWIVERKMMFYLLVNNILGAGILNLVLAVKATRDIILDIEEKPADAIELVEN